MSLVTSLEASPSEPPRYVVLEGPDGAGKSTLALSLAGALTARGVRASAWRHQAPGGDRLAAALHYAGQRRRAAPGWHGLTLTDRWYHSTEALAEALELQLGASPETEGLVRLAALERSWLPEPAGVILVDAPDAVLDARLWRRRETVTELDRAVRKAYRRRATEEGWPVVDTSTAREAGLALALSAILGLLGRAG